MEIFSRTEEMEALRRRLASRKSTLVYGPSGVGKTLLTARHARCWPCSLLPRFVESTSSVSLPSRTARSKVRCDDPAHLSWPLRLSSRQVFHLVEGNRYQYAACGKLSHRPRPFEWLSPVLAAMVSEVMLSCSTPIVAVARSVHMEDAGFVSPLLPDRSERLAIKNFDSDVAKAFALEVCSRQQLSAENLNSVLDSMIKSSEGNPGAILRMIAMAKQSKYRSDDHIKWSPLYIDFLMEWAAANAL